MNELIKINYETEQPTVSARDLHEQLNIGKRFSAWFETNSKGFIETQVNHIFEEISEKELEIIENLEFYTDFDLEEKISELSEYEKLYENKGGSSQEEKHG